MPNHTSQELAQYILTYCSRSPDQLQYATMHLGRLVRTLELTPPGTSKSRVLEMGAYMQITPALKTRLGYGDVRGCYLGPLGVTEQKNITSSTGETFHCYIDLFNAERDPYPYPDASLDTVICCELFEHLSADPMHLVVEINRILKPGGAFVFSTPNIAALRAIAAVLQRGHPGLYSQFMKPRQDPEPRHAREYTPDEIWSLLHTSGFQIDKLETGPYGQDEPTQYRWVVDLLTQHNISLDLRGDTIHAVGTKTGPVLERYPSWLYD